MIKIIAAIGNKNVLGNANKIPWHLPKDFRRFKELTLGNAVIMGRKTFESLPEKNRPLPQRHNIVITRNQDWKHEGAIVVSSFEEAVYVGEKLSHDMYVIGGGEIYSIALPYASELFLTRVHGDFEGDAFFPEINADWKIEDTEKNKKDEKHQYDYDFERYVHEPAIL